MLRITGNRIALTRGDTAYLTVALRSETDEYTMKSDDVLVLSVKKNTSDEKALIEKSVTGINTIHIEPADTKDLPTGGYKYDVQLRTVKGDVYTVIPIDIFELTPEVTRI